MGFFGPFHSRCGAFVVVHNFARFFEVAMAEFLVQQKIIIGFLCECFEITSGSLRGVCQSDNSGYHLCMIAYFASHILSNAKSFPLN